MFAGDFNLQRTVSAPELIGIGTYTEANQTLVAVLAVDFLVLRIVA